MCTCQVLWRVGNQDAALSTASECAAMVQEVAVPVSPQLGRALCAGEGEAVIQR